MFWWRIKMADSKTAVAIFLFAVSLVACQSERQPAAFYPVDSLIMAQVYWLTEMKAGVFKEALVSGQTDTALYRPADTVAWKNELDIFRRLDVINKPVNRDRYLVDDGLLDPESNLTVKAFTFKGDGEEDLPVEYLKIYYQETIDKPRKIEALYSEKNPLYASGRMLSMQFQQINDETVLTSYSIKGGQRMILADSVAFYISGKILVDQ